MNPLSRIKESKNKTEYLQAAINYFALASRHAEEGDIPAAALSILKALDQERRASCVGPQVLQLIKSGL